MRSLVYVLMVLVALVSATRACPDSNRTHLLDCFVTVLGLPSYSAPITSDVIDAFLNAQRALGAAACIPQAALSSQLSTGANFVRICDTNSDGVLSVADDWNSPKSCLLTQHTQDYMCNVCAMCMAAKRKK